MFWTDDLNILLTPVLLPTDNMLFDEKLNALTRLVIFICILASFVLQDTRFLLFMIILVIIIIIIYNYNSVYKQKIKEEFLNVNDLDVVDNEICVKPSKHNPMMNPNLIDVVDYEKYNINGACPIYNEKIKQNVEEIFDRGMFLNANDIYNRSSSKRQFYTVPVNKLPNDQSGFAHWLYDRGPSCKEENDRCSLIKYYEDMRL